jgi:two-component system, cell cycle response regulator
MNLRILVVEAQPEHTLFLREVLAEMETAACWSEWIHLEPFYSSTWSEAAAILDREIVDVILLDPELDGCGGLGTGGLGRCQEVVRRFQAVAPHVPVVLLVDPPDAAFAERLLRDGVQDFLIRKDIDCIPLAHAILSARERHRLLTAARADSMTDPLTGLMNRRAFLTLADRDRSLAKRLNHRMTVLLSEPRNLNGAANQYTEQRRDLSSIETADHLRTLTGPADLVAHLGEGRFAVAVIETDFESAEETLTRMLGATAQHKMTLGAAIFDPDRPVSLEELLEQAALDLPQSNKRRVQPYPATAPSREGGEIATTTSPEHQTHMRR